MPLTDHERDYLTARFNEIVVGIKQGELLEITYVKANGFRRSPGRRAMCRGFTPSARLRMLKTVAKIHWESVGPSLFLTLTYPDAVANRTMEERTKDRHRFLRDMENYLGRETGALWRIEWQARKSGKLKGTMVPHVHLIVFDCKWLPWTKLCKLWQAVLAVDGVPVCYVQRIRGQRDVAKYVCKYAAKPVDASLLVVPSYLNITGRHWGIHRPSLIPWCERRTDFRLTPAEMRLLENAAATKIPYFLKGTKTGFCLFGPVVKQVMEEIRLRRLDNGKGFD